MTDTLSSVIELAVGTASLGAGIAAWRSGGPRWLGVVLCVAGLAACAHAIVDLIR